MKKLFAVAGIALLASACNPQETTPPANAAKPDNAAATDSQAAAPVEYKVVNMSPQKTSTGTPFNVQIDQGSGISFELNRPVPPGDIKVMFDGKPLGGVAANGVIVTATIPESYLSTAGTYPITLQLPGQSGPLAAGNFSVE